VAVGSRLLAIEQRLKVIIAAQTDIAAAAIQVSRGHPGDLIERECVWIGEVRFGEAAKVWVAGQNPRDQDVTVELYVDVKQEGDDQDALRDRVYTIGHYVEKALQGDPSLNGEAHFGGVSGGASNTFTYSDARGGLLRLDANYKVRFTG
jgi:hypothetical protein